MDGKQGLTRKIRLKNNALLFVVAGLFIVSIFSPDRAWDILLAAFGGALLLSTLWALSLWQGLNFHREMRQGWAEVGDRFHEQFIVSNKFYFPALAVTVIDQSNFPGYQSRVAWPVAGKFDRLWFMDSFCSKRGLYRVGPTEIRARDPFGVFEIRIKSSYTQEILITPPIVPLKKIDFAAGDWYGNGGDKAKMFERTVTAGSVREYVPGDSQFAIHWLTTARQDDFYVRTYDQQPSSDWWIILDMDRFVHLGKGPDASEEYAAIVAASIADRGLKENRTVGLIGEGSRPVYLPPKTGAGQRQEIMYALAQINKGHFSLQELLSKSQRFMGRKSSAIIITPSADPAWLTSLTTLKHRGITPTLLLLDQEDFGGMLSHQPIINQLDAWGIRHFLINKSIYSRPRIPEFLLSQGIYSSDDRHLSDGVSK